MGIRITAGARTYDRIQVTSFTRQQSTEPPYRTSVALDYIPFAYSTEEDGVRLYDSSMAGSIVVEDYVAEFMVKLAEMKPEQQAEAMQLSIAADAGYAQIIALLSDSDLETEAVQ